MTHEERERIEHALSAHEEDIAGFLHDMSPNVIRALLQNPRLTEDDVLIIATRKNLPSDVLETIAKNKRWLESYPIKVALVKNPKTPLSVSLSIARYIRLFDLAEISRSRFLPIVLRQKLEAIIIEKMPGMALGMKKALARIVSGGILQKLIQDGYPDVVKVCLDSPYLLESHLFKIINRQNTTAGTIRAIAEHKNWSTRSMVKFALVRNEHTPLSLAVQFLAGMKLLDLRELHADPSIPVSVKPFIHRELLERGEEPGKVMEDQVFEIEEEDEEMIEKFKDAPEQS